MNNTTNELLKKFKVRSVKKILIIGLIILLAIIKFSLLCEKFNHQEIIFPNYPSQVYEKYKNAVVLVKHTYAIQISIKECKPFQIKVKDGFFDTKTIYGTGFFISKEGEMVTIDYIAEPWKHIEAETLTELKNHIASILPDSINEKQYKKYLEAHWNDYYNDELKQIEKENLDYENQIQITKVNSATLTTEVNDLTAQNQSEYQLINKKNSYTKIEDIEIIPHSIEICIALNGSKDSWLKSDIITTTGSIDIDVAFMKLTSNVLPKSVNNIIDLNTAVIDDGNFIKGNNVILIGYDMPMQLTSKHKTLKGQVYQGKIIKESNGVNIQYKITSSYATSGSPVFNESGRLIAINYTGYEKGKDYNFGITAQRIISIIQFNP